MPAMEMARTWCCLVILATTSGCGVAKELCRYTREQVVYRDDRDECSSRSQFRILAGSYWLEFEETHPECAYSNDYSDGFKAGFVDHLLYGPGATAVIPPRRYWHTSLQTPEGHGRGEEWLEGFRVGANAAEQSGYRSWVTVPVSYSVEPQ